MLKNIENELNRVKETGDFDRKVAELTGFELATLTFDYSENAYTIDETTQKMAMTSFDISSYFNKAGKLLGEGLHMEYWIKNSKRDLVNVQTEIIVVAGDMQSMQNLNDFANEKFLELYEHNKRSISSLNESRKTVYEKLINTSDCPIPRQWELPEAIDFSESEDSVAIDKHLFIKADGEFKARLNRWEIGVVKEELNKGAIAWLRNLDRKKWSLEIPYESNGIVKPMFPDFLIVRKYDQGYVFDILEPHDPSNKDNCDKARGLARFADEHWGKFDKIQLIRQQRGVDGRDHFSRLDMSKVEIRNNIRGITSNSELDRILCENAIIEEEKTL